MYIDNIHYFSTPTELCVQKSRSTVYTKMYMCEVKQWLEPWQGVAHNSLQVAQERDYCPLSLWDECISWDIANAQ